VPGKSPDIPAAESRAAMLSVIVGVTLLALKFFAYFLTGSMVIFSDAMESITNVIASCFAAYAVWYAHRPADSDHPYGHGKIEFLSATLEGGMIIVAAIFICVEAVQNLIRGPAVSQLFWGTLIVAFSMLINGGLGWFLIRSGKRSGSITLEADGRHVFSDAITSVAVLIALGLIKLTGINLIDPIAALVVALYIGWTGMRLIRRGSAGLMDEQDSSDARALSAILDAHIGSDGKPPQICSYHKLRHRHSGRYHWVDFHIMVPAHWDITHAHQVASSIEHEMELLLGEGNATAHVEPCLEPGCPHCEAAK
jgi:cation diffusion facilitator family transporter